MNWEVIGKAAVCCAAVSAGVMLFAHRRVIASIVTGKPLPEPSEAAKVWCPPVVAAEAAKAAK